MWQFKSSALIEHAIAKSFKNCSERYDRPLGQRDEIPVNIAAEFLEKRLSSSLSKQLDKIE